MSDEEFQQAEFGSDCYPVSAGELKKGGFVVINKKPCKVVEVSFAKTGKHGHAKANILAEDIFTGKKVEDCRPSSYSMQCPVIVKKDHALIDVDADGYCTYFEDGEQKTHLRLPPANENDWVKDLLAAFREGKDLVINVITALGSEVIVGFREDRDK